MNLFFRPVKKPGVRLQALLDLSQFRKLFLGWRSGIVRGFLLGSDLLKFQVHQ